MTEIKDQFFNMVKNQEYEESVKTIEEYMKLFKEKWSSNCISKLDNNYILIETRIKNIIPCITFIKVYFFDFDFEKIKTFLKAIKNNEELPKFSLMKEKNNGSYLKCEKVEDDYLLTHFQHYGDLQENTDIFIFNISKQKNFEEKKKKITYESLVGVLEHLLKLREMNKNLFK